METSAEEQVGKLSEHALKLPRNACVFRGNNVDFTHNKKKSCRFQHWFAQFIRKANFENIKLSSKHFRFVLFASTLL